MKKHIKILLSLTLLLSTWLATAQVYPVQVSTQLIPPHNVKLSAYQSTSAEKLFVNLLLTDVATTGRQVRLKMYIEGQGLAIQSVDMVAGTAPIFLDGGVNLRLSNLDLQAYFDINNLQGINYNQYNHALPDGRYDFCFEVYDYLSGQRISQKTCTSIYLILNDPPILNMPGRGDLVTATDPQNIVFTWTPRHINATQVQYEFILKELWDTGMDPQAAFMASPVLFQTTSYATTFLYGPGELPLLEGKTYGWQVRAVVTDGISETTVFRNDGYSEVFHFVYEANCDPPQYVLSEVNNYSTATISWNASEHLKYQIQYRKAAMPNAEWFSTYAYNLQTVLRNLEAGTTYEFRVGGKCTDAGAFSYGNIQQFSTPSEDEEPDYSCGIMPEITIENQFPLQNIGVGEVFTAGDFPVTVLEVSGSNGVYTGWGYIVVPYLGDTKLKVDFEQVHLNTDYQLTAGIVKTMYDADWGDIFDADDFIEGLTGDDGDMATYDASDIAIQSITVSNGSITIVDNNGVSHTIVTPVPVVITGAGDDLWQVNADGSVEHIGPAAEGGAPTADNTNGINGGEVTEISSPDVQVIFQTNTGYYATDQLPANATEVDLVAQYETIPTASGGTYNVVYKAVSDITDHATDTFEAEVSFSNGKTKSDLVFKTMQGVKVDTMTWQGNRVKLKVKKRSDFIKGQILATVKPADSTGRYDIAGKANLWELGQKSINVTVVPFAGTAVNKTDVENQVKAIYGKVGVKLNIHVATNDFAIAATDWDLNGDGKLEIGDSASLANYTPEERAIYQKYKNTVGVEAERYYIFMVNKPTLDGNVKGFMPLKRQYGFVFNQIGTANQAKTIAHELGHGIFGLEHPFTDYDYDSAEDHNLLMEYGSGTTFSHMDWQKIHAPGLQLYLFQSDEDGEYRGAFLISKIIQDLRCKLKNTDNLVLDETLNNYISSAFTDYEEDSGMDPDWEYSDRYRLKITRSVGGTPTTTSCKVSISRKRNNPPTAIIIPTEPVVEGNYHTYDFNAFKISSNYDSKNGYDGTTFLNYLTSGTYNIVEIPPESEVQNSSVTDTVNIQEVVIIYNGIDSYIAPLISDNVISNREFKIIKSIASCDAAGLSVDTRFKIIKRISSNWFVFENDEDLVLDLLLTTKPEDYVALLDRFQADSHVYDRIKDRINAGQNQSRFYDELYDIWSNSTYFNEPYAYHSGTYPTVHDATFYAKIKQEIENFIFLSQGDSLSQIPVILKNDNGTFTFMTLNGSYITLPENVANVHFVTGLEVFEEYIKYPTGALFSFTIDEEIFEASTMHSDMPDTYEVSSFDFTFNGYKSKVDNHLYNGALKDYYDGNVILLKLNYINKSLNKVEYNNLAFQETGTVNILSNGTFFETIYTNDIDETIALSYPPPDNFNSSSILNRSIVGEVLQGNDSNNRYLYFSKLAVTNNSYKETMESYFADNVEDYPTVSVFIPYIYLKNKTKQELINHYLAVLNYIKNESSQCESTLDNITVSQDGTASVNSDVLHTCLENLTDSEIENISVDDKIKALSILINEYDVGNAEEIQVVRLLKFTKNEDVGLLLTKLMGKSKVDTDKFLLPELTSSVDNDHTFIYDENYKALIKVLTELAYKSTSFQTEVQNLSSGDLFTERKVNFHNATFWNNFTSTFSMLTAQYTGDQMTWNPDTSVDFEEINDAIYLSIHNNMEAMFFLEDTNPAENSISQISPFAPIWFFSKSSLSMLDEYNNKKQLVVPAIIAYYADDVSNTENIIDGTNAIVDAVSIGTGAGALLKGATTLRKVFIISDMIGSGVSMVTTATVDSNLSPATRDFLNALNAITATVAITDMASSSRSLKTLFGKAKQNTSNLPTKAMAHGLLDEIVKESTRAEDLAAGGMERLNETEVWLKHFELEGTINSAESSLKTKAQNARTKINDAKQLVTTATSTRLTTFLARFSGDVTQLENKINGLDNLAKTKFLNDFADATDDVIDAFSNPNLVDAWGIISHRRIDLRTNTDALEAISKIRINPKYADFGLNDDLLGQLKGWGYGVDNGASYAEVITDLDRLLTNCGTNNINISNFNKITDVLKASNTANTKGMHWIIQDLADDVATFNNKTITLEFTVPNARGTSSYLDVYCSDCFTGGKRLLVEYKYGPSSITKNKIIEQFIERDLFNPNITSINQIQWRLKETGFTKAQLNTWLNNTPECRTAIKDLGVDKINQLLGINLPPNTPANILSNSMIDYLNDLNNFNQIFKINL